MGTASYPGVKSGWGVTLTPHPLLVPWSRKGRAIPLLPLWAVRPVQILSARTRLHFTLFWYRTLHGSDRFTVRHQESSTVPRIHSNRYMSYRLCCLSASIQSALPVWHIPIAVYTVLDYWWWTVNLSETCRDQYQNKSEKQCSSLVFIIRIYQDARSYKCQIHRRFFARAFTFPRRSSKSPFLSVRMLPCTNKLHLFSPTQHRLTVVQTVTFIQSNPTQAYCSTNCYIFFYIFIFTFFCTFHFNII